MTKKQNKPIEQLLEEALILYEKTPYKVPDNWCWTRLGNIGEIITGGTPNKNNKEYYGGFFPFIKPADLNQGRRVLQSSEYLTEKGKNVSRVIPTKSIAVCCIGTIGKSGFLEIECATNQQINSIVPFINKLYVYYYCNSFCFI